MSLPAGPLVAFYGDDFTGSTAVMEVLTFNGLPTILYLGVPTPEQQSRHEGYRGIGIAGVARSQSPQWMRENLPGAYAFLASLDAKVRHYKTCSTLDSAPHVGSIGTAAEIGREHFDGAWIPFLVAAPAIRRYQAFGNLFADYAGDTWRIDRHPVMQRHPVTPMDEGDVRLHLARQTRMPLGLVDLVSMKEGRADIRLAAERAAGAGIVALDTVDDETLREAGRLIWKAAEEQGDVFCIGSQVSEYALCAWWQDAGLLPRPPAPPRAAALGRIAAVSGSVSPVTASQIDWAEANGFRVVQLDAAAAVDGTEWQAAVGRAVDAALAGLDDAVSPLIVTARGPDDPATGRLRDAVRNGNVTSQLVMDRIGDGLGRALAAMIRATGTGRALIAGGDTSGHAAMAMGVHALEARAAIAPGAALCRAFAADPALDGLELALKGGQMGAVDYFGAVRAGGRPDG